MSEDLTMGDLATMIKVDYTRIGQLKRAGQLPNSDSKPYRVSKAEFGEWLTTTKYRDLPVCFQRFIQRAKIPKQVTVKARGWLRNLDELIQAMSELRAAAQKVDELLAKFKGEE